MAAPAKTPQRSGPDYLEVAGAVILSVAALVSSWASYQSGLWDGDQAARYSQANAERIKATRSALEGDTREAVEVQMFEAWLDARVRGNTALQDFYEAHMPTDMKPAFNAWLAETRASPRSAAPTPFAMPAYRRPGAEETARLDRSADEIFNKGQYANAVSDAFEQGATGLALALFFGGIGQVFRRPGTRVVLVAVASAALLFGLMRIVSLPIQILGLGPPAA